MRIILSLYLYKLYCQSFCYNPVVATSHCTNADYTGFGRSYKIPNGLTIPNAQTIETGKKKGEEEKKIKGTSTASRADQYYTDYLKKKKKSR